MQEKTTISIPVDPDIIAKVYAIFVMFNQGTQNKRYSVEVLPPKKKDKHLWVIGDIHTQAYAVYNIIRGITLGLTFKDDA